MRHPLEALREHFNDRPDFIQSDDDGPERTLSIARPLRYDTTIEIPLKMPTESSDSYQGRSDNQERSSGQGRNGGQEQSGGQGQIYNKCYET